MNKNILVVDDDVDIQFQLKAILEENGFHALVADNRRSAREILEKEAVDLILLDVMMEKDSDGFNFAQEMKGNEKYKKIPIIMVTAVNQKMPFKYSPEEDGDFLPVEKFMEKPIDLELLIKAINEFL
jgi:CheY-like chemotaxis protein